MPLGSWARPSRAGSLVPAVRQLNLCNGRRIIPARLGCAVRNCTRNKSSLITYYHRKDEIIPAVLKDRSQPGDAPSTGQTFPAQPFSKSHGLDDELTHYLGQLRRGERLYGEQFVERAWQDMRTRDLPVDGPVVDQIWRIFACRPGLQDEVFQYACDIRYRRGEVYDGLYDVILTSTRSGPASSILRWHQRFLKEYWVPQDCLSILVVKLLERSDFFHLFQELHTSTDQKYHRAYDTVIGGCLERLALSKEKVYLKAWRASMPRIVKIHDFLIGQGDRPSQSFIMNNQARFPLCHPNTDKFMSTEASHRIYEDKVHVRVDKHSTSAVPGEKEPYSRSSLNGAESVSSLFDLNRSQGLSDEFTARMFAAGTFSIDTIIKGLSIFGSPTVGSEALRQICLQVSCDVDVLAEKINLMKQFDVNIEETAFTRVVRYFCEMKQPELLQSLAVSPIDPAVFDSRAALEKQIQDSSGSRSTQDWHLLQTANRFLYPEPLGASCERNKLLRTHARNRDLVNMSAVIARMKARGEQVTGLTLNVIWNSFTSSRRQGQRTMLSTSPRASGSHTPHNGPIVLANLWLEIMRAGTPIDPMRWRKPLIDVGMGNDFRRFSMLCKQIVQAHQQADQIDGDDAQPVPKKVRSTDTAEVHTKIVKHRERDGLTRQEYFVSTLFNPEMQRAIVHWGFQTGMRKYHRMKRIMASPGSRLQVGRMALQDLVNDSLQGLRLLQNLESMQVKIDKHTVVRAIRYRIWMLVSPGISSRSSNRTVRAAFNDLSANNDVSVVESILRTAEQMWWGPGNLLPVLWQAPNGSREPSSTEEIDERPASSVELTSSAADHCVDAPAIPESVGHPPLMEKAAGPEQVEDSTAWMPDYPLPRVRLFNERLSLEALPDISALPKAVQVARAKYLMLSMFGTNPKLGGLSHTDSRGAYIQNRRLGTREYEAWLHIWATESVSKKPRQENTCAHQDLRQQTSIASG